MSIAPQYDRERGQFDASCTPPRTFKMLDCNDLKGLENMPHKARRMDEAKCLLIRPTTVNAGCLMALASPLPDLRDFVLEVNIHVCICSWLWVEFDENRMD